MKDKIEWKTPIEARKRLKTGRLVMLAALEGPANRHRGGNPFRLVLQVRNSAPGTTLPKVLRPKNGESVAVGARYMHAKAQVIPPRAGQPALPNYQRAMIPKRPPVKRRRGAGVRPVRRKAAWAGPVLQSPAGTIPSSWQLQEHSMATG